MGDSFKRISNGLVKHKFVETAELVLCSTNSYVVHLLSTEREVYYEIDELIQRLNKDCSFKAIRASTAFDKMHTAWENHSVVTLFMVHPKRWINDFLQTVTRNGVVNSSQKFLLILKSEYNVTMVEDIFEKFIELNFFNVVVIIRNVSNVSIIKYKSHTGTIYSIDDAVSFFTKNKNDIFARNWNDLRGRSLVVSMYEQNDRAVPKTNGKRGYTGVDGLTADLLEERMNASFTYITPSEMYNGHKNSGVIGDLTRGRADIGLNAESLAMFLVKGMLDVTESIERNDICILVPKAGDEPIIYNLLRTLSKTTWFITLLSLVVMTLVYRWTQNIQKFIHSKGKVYYEYSWTEVSTIIFQSFFGDSITRIPISMPLRILIIGWCIYSFLITNAFQAKLITSLVIPRRLNDIDTIEELGHTKLKVMYPRALADHIREYSSHHTLSILQDQLVEVESWNKFDAAIRNKSSSETAFVMTRFNAELMVNKHFDKTTGRPLFKTMKECLLSFPRVYFLKLGSMYVEYVNELLRRFHESGFIVKWTRYADFLNGLQGNVQVDDIEDDTVDESNIKIVITTDHLQTSFYILFIGLAAASFVFIGEHIYNRWEEVKSNKIEYFDKERARQFGCRID